MQAVSFTEKTQPGSDSRWHADFNGDGREDFVVPAPGGFDVILSTGGGTYAAPVFYPLASGKAAADFAIGNFVGSSGDLVVIDSQTASLFVFRGNGNGTFAALPAIATSSRAFAIVAGDFNHDGHMDVAYLTQDPSASDGVITTAFGPVTSGAFSGTATTVASNLFNPGEAGEQTGFLLGDFDGDGKADIMTEDCEQGCEGFVYYGDGTGHFPGQVTVSVEALTQLRPFDLNGDGKMDLVGLPFAFPLDGEIFYNHLAIYYGNAARTWSETKITTSRCVAGDESDKIAVGDFNGDGIPDLAFEEVSNCDGSFPHFLIFKTGKGGGAFNSDITFETFNDATADLETLRSDRNNKPDVAFGECTSTATPCSPATLHVQLDLTTGAFPTCGAPNGFLGIHVCGPLAGSTVSSPVSFHVAAVGQTPMRKIELWVDGHKVSEQFRGAFSKYAFLDKSVSLAAGSHKVTIFAAGWDNWVEKKSFSITVN